MERLDRLTKEQETLMRETQEDWINLFFWNVKERRGIDTPAFEEGVTFLYQDLLKKEKPTIVYCDSWISCLITIAILKDGIPCSSVRASVLDSVRDSVRDSVWNSVWASVRNSVGNSVRDSVRTSVREIYGEYSYHGDISDFGWVAFFDFFQKIGILCNPVFERYKKFIRSTAFAVYPYEGMVFAVQPPVYIGRNAAGRLHSTTTAAVKFRDGSGYYFINGRSIPAWVIEEKEKITKKQFLSEKNAEIKGAIYASLGQKGIMELLGAESVDVKEITHANGDSETVELLKTRERFEETGNNPFAWVKVVCPSTGTNYLLGVEPHHTNAREAVASLSPFNSEEYSYNYRT